MAIDKDDLDRLQTNIMTHIDLKTQPIQNKIDDMNGKNEADHMALFGTVNGLRERTARVETRQKTVFGFLAAVGAAVLGGIGKMLVGGK